VRVAIYRRISTDEERQPFSLEAQQERLVAYVAAQPGWVLTRSYSDRMSGKRLDRPGLQQALADAGTGRYDLLLVFKVDRLARSTGGLARVLEELDKAGVAFRSASEPFDTSTAAGRMMMQMLGVFAEFEREMIVERTRMGLARKAAKGEWTGGKAPFGYRYDAEAQTLIPVPTQAALVERIFTLYVDRRLGSAAISGRLNDAGHRTSRGCRWTPNRILGVLRNPTYIGQLPFNGDHYQARHNPIVEAALFDRAQLLLAERSDSASVQAANASDYLLTSLLRCRRCGHGFVGTAAHGNGGVYRYYTCFSRQRHGTARCDQERLPAGPLEEAILNETLAALDDGAISRRPPNVPGRPGTPSTPAAKPNWPASRPPSKNGVRLATGICEPSRPSGCPSRPARTASSHLTKRCRRWQPAGRLWKQSARRPLQSQLVTSSWMFGAGSSGPWPTALPSSSSDCWTRWWNRSWSSRGLASSHTSSRPRFVRVSVRGGGRESNPPEQGRCSHRF
jgi:DNA invertase Pin-like site-specific DNA recombinase